MLFDKELRYLEYVGLKINYKDTFKEKLLQTYVKFAIFWLFIANFMAFHYVLTNLEDYKTIINSFAPAVSSALIFVKIVSFSVKKDRYKVLMKYLMQVTLNGEITL